MTGHIVKPRSRKNIREKANKWREVLGLSDNIYLKVPEIFEILPIIYPELNTMIDKDENFEPRVYADTDISKNLIRVRESTYDKACMGDGFSRMTIMHEVGHYELLRGEDIKLKQKGRTKRKLNLSETLSGKLNVLQAK